VRYGYYRAAHSDFKRGSEVELALAALLAQMMRADSRSAGTERRAALHMLARRFKLDRPMAEALLARGERAADEAISLFEHTRTLDRHLSEREKFAVIEALWETAFADGELDRYEDDLAHRLADLLHVRHSDLIRIKHVVMRRHG